MKQPIEQNAAIFNLQETNREKTDNSLELTV